MGRISYITPNRCHPTPTKNAMILVDILVFDYWHLSPKMGPWGYTLGGPTDPISMILFWYWFLQIVSARNSVNLKCLTLQTSRHFHCSMYFVRFFVLLMGWLYDQHLFPEPETSIEEPLFRTFVAVSKFWSLFLNSHESPLEKRVERLVLDKSKVSTGETAYSAKGQAQILSLDLRRTFKQNHLEITGVGETKACGTFFLHQPSWKHWQVAGNEHVATVVCSIFDNFRAALSKFHCEKWCKIRPNWLWPQPKMEMNSNYMDFLISWLPTTWFSGAIC